MMYTVVAFYFLIGIYCIMAKRNLIKIIMGLIIVQYSADLFLSTVGFHQGEILISFTEIIGIVTTIVLVFLSKKIYNKIGSFDVSEMRRLKG